ncbi:MAG: CaiB/BaiF CoA transferase family protein [Acidimicrobiales bacterium]|jgi:crotonobetainyl-CoA:carnitine CoA-transferase CaiB-like acyl-CoA transferase
MLPLDGVRIVDLTTVVMGPLATRMLADMGADVIRVESPEGDVIRDYQPMRSPKMSAFGMNLNRNKRSIVLDFKDTDDRATLDRLIATADVVVTNMRRSALARLGLDEAGVRAVKPDVIYCIANGYGSDGPKADDAAYDDVIQAASGLASMFSWVGDEPRLVPSIYADKITGVHVAFAISSALHGRARTGKGCSIEVPMAETMAAFNMVEHLSGHTFEPHLGSFSYNRIRTPHRKPRQTTDGWIVILPYSDDNWQQFWTFGERPDYLDDERFATQSKRVDHADALYSLLDGIIAMKSTVEWLGFCAEHSIPASEVIELEHLGDDPHFAAVELIRSDVHPTEGAYRYVRDPIRIDGTTAPLRHHAPRLGADTDAILSELE